MSYINKDELQEFLKIESALINNHIKNMIKIDEKIRYCPEYGLFHMIRENVVLNYLMFERTVIEMDSFVFPSVKRNTRCCIEAFVDLYNLVKDVSVDKKYMEVLKKVEIDAVYREEEKEHLKTKLSYNEIVFKELIDNNFPMIGKYNVYFSTKLKIATNSGLSNELTNKMRYNFKKYSSFAHPSIFVPIERQNDITIHDDHGKSLIEFNLIIMRESIILLLEYFNAKFPTTYNQRLSQEKDVIIERLSVLIKRINTANSIINCC